MRSGRGCCASMYLGVKSLEVDSKILCDLAPQDIRNPAA